MRILSREDLIHILYGCAILGTGGGGSLEEGIAMIDEALAAGRVRVDCKGKHRTIFLTAKLCRALGNYCRR